MTLQQLQQKADWPQSMPLPGSAFACVSFGYALQTTIVARVSDHFWFGDPGGW